ncbi:MAG: chromosomal replication initiator protein DnaA [Clostridia bacterium]|nr:chromosomal replication initiator protein DnaA [Clostridia bacterium]
MEQLTKMWHTAREYIRPQITAMSFQRWIESLSPLCIQNGVLVMQAPDETVKATLQEYYFDYLIKAVKRVNPSIFDVMLVLPSQRSEFVREEPKLSDREIPLNPKFTFDTFVVGKSNEFAYGAAYVVAKDTSAPNYLYQTPTEKYNPLFIYGGVGLGKTHLMHAIGHVVRETRPNAKIIYVTSEDFTNELIEALRVKNNMEFRQRYRNVDLLMIDDIQFIANKPSMQEELFHTFNTLYNAGKQIVFSSDRPPKEIPSLEERLSSRFEWGLIVDIQEPDLETRIAILRNRVKTENLMVDDDIITFIAEHVHSNIRQLEGCLTRVLAYGRLKGKTLNLSLAADALKELLPETKKTEITPDLIKGIVCEFYGISLDSLMSQRRDKEVVIPRQVSMYLCHSLLSLPYKRIANLFDRDDHTTARSAYEKIDKMIKNDPSFAKLMEDLTSRVTSF